MRLRGDSGKSYNFRTLPASTAARAASGPGVFVFIQSDGAARSVLFVGMSADLSEALGAPAVAEMAVSAAASHTLVLAADTREERRAIKEDLCAAFRPPLNAGQPAQLGEHDFTAFPAESMKAIPDTPGLFAFATAERPKAGQVLYVGMTASTAAALANAEVARMADEAGATHVLVLREESSKRRRRIKTTLVAEFRPRLNDPPSLDLPVLDVSRASGGKYEFGLVPVGDAARFGRRAGVFALTTDRGGSHAMRYVGMTQDAAGALATPDVVEATKTAGATHVAFLEESDFDARASIKAELISRYDPPLNRPAPEPPPAPADSTSATPSAPVSLPTRQCGMCSGLGTCGACGGSGGRQSTRVDYDWEGNPQYNSVFESCYSCSGGSCSACYGRGYVYA